MTDNTRDIVIQLRSEVHALTARFEATETQVTEMHELLLRARGAQWAVYVIAGVIGMVAAKAGTWFAWLLQNTPVKG